VQLAGIELEQKRIMPSLARNRTLVTQPTASRCNYCCTEGKRGNWMQVDWQVANRSVVLAEGVGYQQRYADSYR